MKKLYERPELVIASFEAEDTISVVAISNVQTTVKGINLSEVTDF